MAIDPKSGLWLPNSVASKPRSVTGTTVGSSGQHKTIRIDNMEFWSADGQVFWRDNSTGVSDAMFPDRAIQKVNDMAKNLLGQSLDTSICTSNRDKARLIDALRALKQLAEEEMVRMPDRRKMEQLLG